MAIFILLFIVIFDALHLFYIVLSKKHSLQIEININIGFIFVFSLLLITSIINWNFRWYFLLSFLFFRLILSVITKFKKYKGNNFNLRNIYLKKFLVVLITLISISPAIIFPEYRIIEPTGNYNVESISYTYYDSNRTETFGKSNSYRKLNVTYWYPENPNNTYPLIVFSHGSFGIRTSNESLFNELASQGYVIVSIDHTYHSLFTDDIYGKRTWIDWGYMQEVNIQDAHKEKEQSLIFFRKWMKLRKDDINFVIDHVLLNINENKPYNLICEKNIGVIGHSLGGSAALAIGRTREEVKAVIALESPFMDDIIGVENDVFIFDKAMYPKPLLKIYSDASWNNLFKWPQYKINYLMLYEKESKHHNVYIKGIGHLSLTDLSLSSPILTRLLNGQKDTKNTDETLKIINSLSLNFFNYYLKDGEIFEPDKIY